MKSAHVLVMDQPHLFHKGLTGSVPRIKWEVFNDEFDKQHSSGEHAIGIFKRVSEDGMSRQGVLEKTFGSGVMQQPFVGASSQYVVGEGGYRINMRARLEKDTTQWHVMWISTVVKYKATGSEQVLVVNND